ncbi:hypothetical protein F383_36456 [Gossypium arboreum]|uniref:Uncharacterized protein n=1 Tax=Gossypium arboreum TaxID=29729 RepID=A0A0B0NB60_GOSAR|nr:hypothetical protein F383_36456 [Gossypium arboreum]
MNIRYFYRLCRFTCFHVKSLSKSCLSKSFIFYHKTSKLTHITYEYFSKYKP